jgi:Flp pilus assembly protein TadG
VDVHKQSGHVVLRLDRGSAVIEGAAALGIAFILFAVVVQVALLFTARTTAQAAVDAFARRAAVSSWSNSQDLTAQIEKALPGSRDVEVSVDRSASVVSAVVEFAWDPPGPRFGPVSVRVTGSAPIVSPP